MEERFHIVPREAVTSQKAETSRILDDCDELLVGTLHSPLFDKWVKDETTKPLIKRISHSIEELRRATDLEEGYQNIEYITEIAVDFFGKVSDIVQDIRKYFENVSYRNTQNILEPDSPKKDLFQTPDVFVERTNQVLDLIISKVEEEISALNLPKEPQEQYEVEH